MAIPRDTVELVLASASILEVIGEHVRLKKVGLNWVGLCPFHTEKTPSFSVSGDKGLYKCFGCGRGGNVFTFMMEHQKVSFVESVKQLAARYNIRVPEDEHATERDETRDHLFAATEFAAEFFFKHFSSSGNTEIQRYFKQRQWTEETRKRFMIGYAPDSWDGMLNRVSSSDIAIDHFVASGLLIKRDDGKLYDRFRHRLIFPIHSSFGKIVGFGARAIRPGDEPKYLNSPETEIYNKSHVVYGLFQAAQAIREKDSVIIVEGYADVISLHQAGVRHAVATSGTALTPDQIRLLARYTRNFTFIYDADTAGAKAMARGIDVIVQQGYDVGLVILPSGDDPDSFVLREGKDAFDAALKTSLNFVDYLLGQARAAGAFETPDQKSHALRGVLEVLVKMTDELRRDFYLKYISQKYDVYESVLRRELDKLHRHARRAHEFDPSPARGVSGAELALQPKPRAMPAAEREFLTVVLQRANEIPLELLRHIHVDDFRDESARAVIHVVLEQVELYGMLGALHLNADVGDPDLLRLIADLSIPQYTTSDGWSKYQNVQLSIPEHHLFDAYRTIVAQRLDDESEREQRRLRDSHFEPHQMRRYQQIALAKTQVLSMQSFDDLEQLRAAIDREAEPHGVDTF